MVKRPTLPRPALMGWGALPAARPMLGMRGMHGNYEAIIDTRPIYVAIGSRLQRTGDRRSTTSRPLEKSTSTRSLSSKARPRGLCRSSMTPATISSDGRALDGPQDAQHGLKPGGIDRRLAGGRRWFSEGHGETCRNGRSAPVGGDQGRAPIIARGGRTSVGRPEFRIRRPNQG